MTFTLMVRYLLLCCLLSGLAVLSSCGGSDGPDGPDGPTPLALEAPFYFGDFTIPANNPTTVEGVALGRHLFYENRLSGNNTQSCASCHKQEKAFTDGLAVSTGIDGIAGTRSAMSLANLLWVPSFLWDGRSETLEDQALEPILDPIELHQSLDQTVAKLQATELYPPMFEAAFGSSTVTADHIAKALAQFQRTLISDDSPGLPAWRV